MGKANIIRKTIILVSYIKALYGFVRSPFQEWMRLDVMISPRDISKSD